MTSFSSHGEQVPWLGLLIGLAAVAGYVACFVFAAQTGRLKALDYVLGTVGLGCGLGALYFLHRANAATLQHSFDLIHQGGDPAVSRALNHRFKIAAGTAIACGILSTILLR